MLVRIVILQSGNGVKLDEFFEENLMINKPCLNIISYN